MTAIIKFMTDHMIAFDQKIYIYIYKEPLIICPNFVMDSLFLEGCRNSTYENFRDGFYFNFEFEEYVKTMYTVDDKFIETVVPNL